MMLMNRNDIRGISQPTVSQDEWCEPTYCQPDYDYDNQDLIFNLIWWMMLANLLSAREKKANLWSALKS